MALVKYYKFCFLGYIAYLQNLGHNPFSPFSTSRLCLLSIFNIDLGNKIHSEMRAQWYSTNVLCIACWRLSVIHCEHQSPGWSTWSRITIVHVLQTQTHTTPPKPLLTIRRQQAYYVGVCCFFLFFWKAALIASPPSCSLLMKERNDHQWGMPWGSLGFTLRGTDDISSSRFKGLSSLFEVVARHTLEMIPESMILMKNVSTLSRAK